MATFSNMISVFLCLVVFVSIASSDPPGNYIEAKLTHSMNLFSSDLFKEVSHGQTGKNLIMSAMSANMVLAMLSLGAKGKTLDEINDGLHLPNSAFTKAAYKPVIDKMNAYQYVTMNLANKVYVKEGENFGLSPVYKAYATILFSSEVENIDFNQNVAAAAEINAWVEEKTNKTVKDIVKASDFDSGTAVVLVNTIYVKGAWKQKFNPNYSEKETFHVSATEEILVDLMIQQNYTNYGENDELDAKMLELKFEGNEMSMVFILPNKVDGLAALEEKLTEDNGKLKAMFDSLQTKFVTMHLPKFEIETTIDLKANLSKLGMSTMFSGNAELGGLLVNSSPLNVGSVIQKAYIYVNEEGVTAGAATAVTGNTEALSSTEFKADHPFCFGLVNSDGQIVFSGHFTGKQ